MKSGDELTSLKDYVTRMEEGQNDICYITGKSKKVVENSPFLEKLKKRGYEEFEGSLPPRSVRSLMTLRTRRRGRRSSRRSLRGLCKVIKEVLGDKVEKMVVSGRVVDFPCYLITGEVRLDGQHGEDHEGAGIEGLQHSGLYVKQEDNGDQSGEHHHG
ncbi:heat shock protein 90-3-like [Panicum miliaceum]|uniref:Heat shock protein 90-3-like n=1 Tax=Panicum miliaceum TaxID=4540 RepID=A0A3L6SS63_PANMI|nr:heat shock protein 90-3-like [Panicum miliaceum]